MYSLVMVIGHEDKSSHAMVFTCLTDDVDELIIRFAYDDNGAFLVSEEEKFLQMKENDPNSKVAFTRRMLAPDESSSIDFVADVYNVASMKDALSLLESGVYTRIG